MNHEIKEPIGSLRISKDVLATIAANATKEIEGVAGIAPFTTNIKNWTPRSSRLCRYRYSSRCMMTSL